MPLVALEAPGFALWPESCSDVVVMELKLSRPSVEVARLAQQALADGTPRLDDRSRAMLEQLAERPLMSSEALAVARATLKAELEGRPVDAGLRFHRAQRDGLDLQLGGPGGEHSEPLRSLHRRLGIDIGRADRTEGLALLATGLLPALFIGAAPVSLGIPALGVLMGVFAGLALFSEPRPNPFPYGTPAYRRHERGG